jgi:hypothetical protein
MSPTQTLTETWLGPAVFTTFGALLGVILKDYFFSRSLERWRHKQSLELLYQKYRDPLFLSASEVASRVAELLNKYPANYLNEKVSHLKATKQRSIFSAI